MPNICKTHPPLTFDPAPACFKDGREQREEGREKPKTVHSLGQPTCRAHCTLWVGE